MRQKDLHEILFLLQHVLFSGFYDEGIFLRCVVVIIFCLFSSRRMIMGCSIVSNADADADETPPIP